MASQAEIAVRTLANFRRDPLLFFTEILSSNPWAAQRQIARTIAEGHREIAIRSCHASGKTRCMAEVVCWYVSTHPESIVITTAPGDRQVKSGVWAEVNGLHANAKVPLGGRLLTQEWSISPNHYAKGFTAPEKQSDKFVGFHARSGNLLVVADEAQGISQEIFNGGISGVMTSQGCQLVMVGNPTNPVGYFAGSFKRPRVKKFKIPAWSTPNFTTFGITRQDIISGEWEEKLLGKTLPRPYLITPHWVREKFEVWGTESPLWVSKVEADFPSLGDDQVFPLHLLEAAQERNLPAVGPRQYGADIARSGNDANTLYYRQGNILRRRYSITGTRKTTETAGHIAAILRDDGGEHDIAAIKIDAIGVGAGVYDCLDDLPREDLAGAEVIEMIGSAAPHYSRKMEFVNARAQWYWEFREALFAGEVDLDPHDDDLINEATQIRSKFDSKGRIQIESKRDMKARGLPSPDHLDAAIYAWADARGPTVV